MTQDEIILLADASGISFYGMGKDRDRFLHHVETFADLVTCFQHHADSKHASVPLYTTPPLRERKPLTDEEIQVIWDVAASAIPGWARHIAYARAIEAAHNIGGAKP